MPGVSTVGELMDYLATQPRGRRVILSSDSEGNNYSPLCESEERMYVAATTWSGQVYLTPEQLLPLIANPESGWSAEDGPPDDKGAEFVVALWPVC